MVNMKNRDKYELLFNKGIETGRKQVFKEIKKLQEIHNPNADLSKFDEGYDTCFWDILNKLEKYEESQEFDNQIRIKNNKQRVNKAQL